MPVAALDPLRFHPIFRHYLWGGHRLRTALRKATGTETCAESWEVVDHGQDQSVVSAGPLAGMTLHSLVLQFGEQLFGQHAPQRSFPLLFKFLDASRDLSVQVHPDDAYAARLNPPDLGKTEAWIVLAAEPGSRIYAGLKPGVDRRSFARALAKGTVASCLHSFEPTVGDCVFIEAGTMHALGAGLLVAEIQQSSDTTYRVFDWNRVDQDGNPRQLHIEEALEVTDFACGPIGPQVPQPTEDTHRERLVACDKFVLDRWQVDDRTELGGDDRFHLLAVLSGSLGIPGDPTGQPLRQGETLLLPACLGRVALSPQTPTQFVDIWLPNANC
ncbi:MAG: class I mannose-6-phosphate isomerase [Planctomycetales bacterium]|nr:class I mannose-6-phosphate isomerase [Planctomycetales bacterium]